MNNIIFPNIRPRDKFVSKRNLLYQRNKNGKQAQELKMNLIILCFIFLLFNNPFAQVIDVNGQTYKTVVIGTQTWMAENLNVDRFKNGDQIPEAKTNDEWKKASENKQPAWCYLFNDPSNGQKFGKLYNWYAVNDPRGLAPEGYYIPTLDDWLLLEEYLGADAAERIKSKNGWNSFGCQECDGKSDELKMTCSSCSGVPKNSSRPFSGNGTNSSGFNALPGSLRWSDGDFLLKEGMSANWWTSTPKTNVMSHTIVLNYRAPGIRSGADINGYGRSVRCIKLSNDSKAVNAPPTLLFFGIDLNKDFYSITDAGKASYEQFQFENPTSQNIPFYPAKSQNLSQFIELGLSKVVIYFPRGESGDFHYLKPSMCIASKVYSNQQEFDNNAYRDYNLLLPKLRQAYGTPTNNVTGSQAISTAWKLSDQQVVLSLDKSEKKLMLMCLPQR